MRLTLRTLLAWLDDTLPPEEVREIGGQVAGTPYAQQLVDRIRTVTRRRRLTVPPTAGPEAVDANMVAAYLDNELEAERVAEYEKLCLGSDVHLAEVASCHQILSLIKNKAKVPPEARYRMYRLFKGPETVRTNYRAAPTAPGQLTGEDAVPGALPGTAGRPPWEATAPARPSALDRFGPPLLAAALIVVLAVVGVLNLRYADEPLRVEDNPLALAGGDAVLVPDEAVPALLPDRAAPPPIEAEEDAEADAEADPDAEAEADADRPGDAEPGPGPAESALPEGVAAQVELADGVALRATRDGGDGWSWTRLEAGAALDPGAVVVNLEPSRTALDLGRAGLTLIGRAVVRADLPAAGRSGAFELIDGDVRIEAAAEGGAVDVALSGRSVTLDLPEGAPIGLSWFGDRAPGEPAGRPTLAIFVPSGTLSATPEGGSAEAFEGPIVVRFDPEAGTLSTVEDAAPPAWVLDADAPPTEGEADADAGKAFAAFFEGSSGPMTFVLLEGVMDEDPAVRRLSVSALGAISDLDPSNLELVAELLNTPDDPEKRAEAIRVLGRQLARGPEPAAAARLQLSRVAPPEAAAPMDRLLTGYPPDRADDPATLVELIGDLSSPNPSVRQLALSTLMRLTGRGDQGYDPDAPEGPGLSAWQALLPAGTPPAGPGTTPPAPRGGDRRR